MVTLVGVNRRRRGEGARRGGSGSCGGAAGPRQWSSGDDGAAATFSSSFLFLSKNFAECREIHTANCLPCVRYLAHDKEDLCRPMYAVGTLPCVTHGKSFAVREPAFAVCLWHTANVLFPVVTLRNIAADLRIWCYRAYQGSRHNSIVESQNFFGNVYL